MPSRRQRLALRYRAAGHKHARAADRRARKRPPLRITPRPRMALPPNGETPQFRWVWHEDPLLRAYRFTMVTRPPLKLLAIDGMISRVVIETEMLSADAIVDRLLQESMQRLRDALSSTVKCPGCTRTFRLIDGDLIPSHSPVVHHDAEYPAAGALFVWPCRGVGTVVFSSRSP